MVLAIWSNFRQREVQKATCTKIEIEKLFEDGKYEEAIVALESFQVGHFFWEYQEISSDCLAIRAEIYLKLGRYAEAVKDCDRAVFLNKANLKAVICRAEAHDKLEHIEKSILDWHWVLEIDPSNDRAKSYIERYKCYLPKLERKIRFRSGLRKREKAMDDGLNRLLNGIGSLGNYLLMNGDGMKAETNCDEMNPDGISVEMIEMPHPKSE